MTKLTKEQAAIIGAYTGILCGRFTDVHDYIEKIMGRPVMLHELGNKFFMEQVKSASFSDFNSITAGE